jgi:polysaccharide pyruvyl transferase WcaK-like protein
MPTASLEPVRDALRTAIRRVTRLDPLAFLTPPRRPSGTRPIVGVVGFYGHGNYGDELFLEVFREHLGGSFDLRSIIDPANVTIARLLGSGIREAEAILIGGGDILKPWPNGSRYWERAYLRRPVFVAGVGVPTWKPSVPESVAELRDFFGHPGVRFVGARDAESAAWIATELAPAAPVMTAPDLVCALTLPDARRPHGQPIFGVAVRSREQPDDLTNIRRLCERAVELGYRVRRIVLATGRVRAQDAIATEGLGLPDTELVSTDDLAEISRAIGECSAITSMKFHGVVVATMYGVPAIATMPTTKTRNFLRGIGRPDLLGVYSNPDLPSFLRPDLAPIAEDVSSRLKIEAVAHLADLRERIHRAIDGRRTSASGPRR